MDHTDVFWDCPVFKGSEEALNKDTDKMMELSVPSDPFIFLSAVTPEDRHSTDQRLKLRILLLIAEKMMTVNWRDEKGPTLTQRTQNGSHDGTKV